MGSVRVVDDSEAVSALFDAVARRDVEAAIEVSDESIEMWPQVIMTLAGREEPYRGHEGIREYYEDIERLFESFEIEVQSARVVKGGAAIFALSRGKPVGGKPIEVPLMFVGRLKEGRVVYVRTHATLADLEAELGSSATS